VASALREAGTPDIGGTASTAEFTALVHRHIGWLRYAEPPTEEAVTSEWGV
jgi:hypothetical protein